MPRAASDRCSATTVKCTRHSALGRDPSDVVTVTVR